MNRKRLEYFLTAAETLNLTETAERHFITQATVSGAIAALEEELGFKLFDRSRRKLRLTAAGEYFYEAGQSVMEVEDRYIRQARYIAAYQEPTLKLGVSYGFCYSRSARALREFQEEHPEMELRFEAMDNSTLLEQVRTSALDGALTFHLSGMPTDRDCDEILLERSRYGVLIPKGHWLEGEGEVTAEQLREEKLLYPVNYTTDSLPTLQGLNRKGIFPTRILKGNSTDELILIAATERCPILLAEFLTEGMTFLNYRFIPFGEGMTNVELTFLKARSNTRPAVRELCDFFSRRGET